MHLEHIHLQVSLVDIARIHVVVRETAEDSFIRLQEFHPPQIPDSREHARCAPDTLYMCVAHVDTSDSARNTPRRDVVTHKSLFAGIFIYGSRACGHRGRKRSRGNPGMNFQTISPRQPTAIAANDVRERSVSAVLRERREPQSADRQHDEPARGREGRGC